MTEIFLLFSIARSCADSVNWLQSCSCKQYNTIKVMLFSGDDIVIDVFGLREFLSVVVALLCSNPCLICCQGVTEMVMNPCWVSRILVSTTYRNCVPLLMVNTSTFQAFC